MTTVIERGVQQRQQWCTNRDLSLWSSCFKVYMTFQWAHWGSNCEMIRELGGGRYLPIGSFGTCLSMGQSNRSSTTTEEHLGLRSENNGNCCIYATGAALPMGWPLFRRAMIIGLMIWQMGMINGSGAVSMGEKLIPTGQVVVGYRNLDLSPEWDDLWSVNEVVKILQCG